MGNISKTYLMDKDIKNLPLKEKQYIKSVGNPKELYIWVNPNGIKSFCVRIDENDKKSILKLKSLEKAFIAWLKPEKTLQSYLKS